MLLKTERLTIRRIAEDDWKSLLVIWKDFSSSDFAQYDIPHDTEETAVKARINKWVKYNDGTEHMFFAICLGDQLIGYVAFNIADESHEVGYCFHSKYHGKGFAKESCTALLKYLKTIGIRRFSAGTALNNKPSVALLKSLGFELHGTESVSFYKDAQGNDITFEGGIFVLHT